MEQHAESSSDELERLEDHRRVQDAQLVDRWRRETSLRSFTDLLARAYELNAVSRYFRVRFTHTYETANIQYDIATDAVSISWEHLDGERVLTIDWLGNTTLAQLFANLRATIRAAADEYGAAWVDLSDFVTNFSDSVGLAIAARNGTAGTRSIGQLIELFRPQWALTDIGLECLDNSYVIHAFRVTENDWRDHMHGKTWVDKDSFDDAFHTLESMYTAHPERFPKDATIPKDESVSDYRRQTDGQDEAAAVNSNDDAVQSQIFIIHGHDLGAAEAAARLIDNATTCKGVILHEQPNAGRTIIEKLEDVASRVAFAVALLTPDDTGAAVRASDARPRARQNVVYEWGYFSGILGRTRTAAILWPGIEIPSDLSGVVYLPWDDQGAWKIKLLREFAHAGIVVDLSQA